MPCLCALLLFRYQESSQASSSSRLDANSKLSRHNQAFINKYMFIYQENFVARDGGVWGYRHCQGQVEAKQRFRRPVFWTAAPGFSCDSSPQQSNGCLLQSLLKIPPNTKDFSEEGQGCGLLSHCCTVCASSLMLLGLWPKFLLCDSIMYCEVCARINKSAC